MRIVYGGNEQGGTPLAGSFGDCSANIRVPNYRNRRGNMESSACIRDRFPTPGSGEAVSTSLDRPIDLPNMPACPSSLIRRLRFEAAGKTRRIRKLEILSGAWL